MAEDVRAALDQIHLDYLEEPIVEMSKSGAQILDAPTGRAGRPMDPGHVPAEVVALATAGKRRDAIITDREVTGADPSSAASVVDSRQ